MPSVPQADLSDSSNTNTPLPVEECSRLEAQQSEKGKRNICTRSMELATLSRATETSEDTFERLLEEKIIAAKPEDQAELVKLRRNYTSVKSSPAYPLCHDIFCYWLTEGQTSGGFTVRESRKFTVDQGATFSQFLSRLSEHLRVAPPGSLRTVVLAAKSRTRYKHKNSFLKPHHKILATFLGRLRQLHFTPNQAVSLLVANTLNVTEPPRFHIDSTYSIHDEVRRSLLPPSLRVQRGNLDPDRLEDDHIHLTWLRKAPKFTADLDVYVWEHHKSLPVAQFVDIRVYSRNGTDQAKLVIAFQHTSSFNCFMGFRNDQSRCPRHSVADGQVWSAESEIFFSICSVFQVVVSETTKFLQECSIELERMNTLARHSPSTDKVRYLIHLHDCNKCARDGLSHGLKVLAKISQWMNDQQIHQQFWDAGQSFSERIQTLRLDMEYLGIELDHAQELNKSLQETTRRHLELTHDRRNFIITIVAAIYLPLSFTTSFFGMNMVPGISDGADGFTESVSDWIYSSPVDLQNATSALASTVGTSSNLNYSWSTFIITAICLLISLPLFLTIGIIFRTVYAALATYAPYWRAAAIVPLIVFFYFSIDSHVPIQDDRHNVLIAYWVLNGVNISLELFKTFQAWSKGRKRSRWTAMLILTLICFILDNVEVSSLFPFMIIPWAVVLIYFVVVWWDRRKLRKSGAGKLFGEKTDGN